MKDIMKLRRNKGASIMSDNFKKNFLAICFLLNLASLVLTNNLVFRILNFLAIILVIYTFSLINKN